MARVNPSEDVDHEVVVAALVRQLQPQDEVAEEAPGPEEAQ